MFKIPTYEELEKKESLRNQDTKDYTSRIFQKRKKDQNSPERLSNPSNSVPEENNSNKNKSQSTLIEAESSSKKLTIEPPRTNESANDPPMKTPAPAANTAADEDDDDELLNNFIIENKDIIESGSQATSSSSSSIKSQKSTEFVVPSAPAPVKFDPKVPIHRAPQILQSNPIR